jgi:hypothetical protein
VVLLLRAAATTCGLAVLEQAARQVKPPQERDDV